MGKDFWFYLFTIAIASFANNNYKTIPVGKTCIDNSY